MKHTTQSDSRHSASVADQSLESIDAHIHLWDAYRGDDILICTQHPELNEQADAVSIWHYLEGSPFDRAIVIQSAPDRGHADWLAEQAAQLPWVAGVVSWIDPCADDALEQSEHLIANPLICGVRLMINRMDEPGALLKPDSLKVLEHLGANDLTIEVLSRTNQLGFVERLVAALPCQFVLDHCGMPAPDAMSDTAWQNDLSKLALHSHLATKVSGLIEAFSTAPLPGTLDPLLDFLLDRFGIERLMAASNLPVVNLRASSEVWTDMLADWGQRVLSPNDRTRLWGGTAAHSYPRVRSTPGICS